MTKKIINNTNRKHVFQPGDIVAHMWEPKKDSAEQIPMGKYIICDKEEVITCKETGKGYTRYKSLVIYSATNGTERRKQMSFPWTVSYPWCEVGELYHVIHHYDCAYIGGSVNSWVKVVESGLSWGDEDSVD